MRPPPLQPRFPVDVAEPDVFRASLVATKCRYNEVETQANKSSPEEDDFFLGILQ